MKVCSFIFSIALLLVATALYAQTQGEITGVVRDNSGAVVPGATVTVTNPATNALDVVARGGSKAAERRSPRRSMTP